MAHAETLSPILAAIRARLTGMPGVPTVVLAMETPPESPELPAIVIRCESADVTLGSSAVWKYPVDVLCLVTPRAGDIAGELALIYDLPHAVIARLSSAQTLGGLTYGYEVRSDGDFGDGGVAYGVFPWRDSSYVGAALHLRYTSKYPLTMEG